MIKTIDRASCDGAAVEGAGLGFVLAEDVLRVVRYTRNWLHYGVIAFIIVCSLIAALRGAVTP